MVTRSRANQSYVQDPKQNRKVSSLSNSSHVSSGNSVLADVSIFSLFKVLATDNLTAREGDFGLWGEDRFDEHFSQPTIMGHDTPRSTELHLSPHSTSFPDSSLDTISNL
jgi:hypothetical protein